MGGGILDSKGPMIMRMFDVFFVHNLNTLWKKNVDFMIRDATTLIWHHFNALIDAEYI